MAREQAELERVDDSVVVPDCDCIGGYKGEKLHRPGCPRIAAILRKNSGPTAEREYLRRGRRS